MAHDISQGSKTSTDCDLSLRKSLCSVTVTTFTSANHPRYTSMKLYGESGESVSQRPQVWSCLIPYHYSSDESLRDTSRD